MIDVTCFTIEEAKVKHKDYDLAYVYGDIRVYTTELDTLSETYLVLSGEGCTLFERLLENLGETWKTFFKKLFLEYRGHFKVKRVDLALDDKNEKPFFQVEQLIKKCKKGQFNSSGRTYRLNESKFLGNKTAKTLYIGVRTSDVMFRIYEKDKEQAIKQDIAIEEIGSWKRTEVEVKNEIAESIIRIIAFSDDSLENTIRGFIKKELVFYSTSEMQEVARFWKSYLGKAKALEIEKLYEVTGLHETERWLEFGGAIGAIKAFQFLSEHRALGELKDVQDMLADVEYPRALSNKLVSHLINIGRDDLVKEVYANTKK